MFVQRFRPFGIVRNAIERGLLQPAAIAKRTYSTRDGLPTPPPIATIENGSQSAEAKTWIEEFKRTKVPKSAVELTYSRSSGPGGQNVNKVNTKATLRCPIDTPWIPLWAREHIKKTPYYVPSSQSILITSSVHRSQAQNVDECLAKLRGLVLSTALAPLVGEPTEAQKERVRALERMEKARLRQEKERRKQVKRGRSGGYREMD